MTVDPGQRLSYQSHARRAEHWVVVSGIATVTLDGTDIDVGPGQSIDIPLQAAHRVANQGTDELVFIEVQLGDYFGEDDIVRYSDDYGRVAELTLAATLREPAASGVGAERLGPAEPCRARSAKSARSELATEGTAT